MFNGKYFLIHIVVEKVLNPKKKWTWSRFLREFLHTNKVFIMVTFHVNCLSIGLVDLGFRI